MVVFDTSDPDTASSNSGSAFCIDFACEHDSEEPERSNSRWSLHSSRSGENSPGRTPLPEARAVPYAQCTWDFFLSHKQSNAQDAVSNLRMELGERLPCRFWLDIEQNPTVHGMCHGVCNSKNFLLFLTTGVTQSKFCMMELRWALQAGRNIVLVSETDERHGKPDVGELIDKCPEDLRVVFEDHVIIPWYRDPELKAVCVTKILKQCVFEVDAERVSVSEKLQRPLMFSNNDELMSLASSELEAVQVIDKSFVFFTSLWGIALPGASRFVRRWAIFVTFLVLSCTISCFTRFFHQKGPSWLDWWSWLGDTTIHLMVFIILQVVLSILRSDLILELLENHIDCSKTQAASLRFRTRVACCLVWILALMMTASQWWGYLPGFLHPDYLGALGNEEPDHRFVFAMVHSFAYAFVLPIMYGSILSTVMMMMLIQKLCFLGFTTNLKRLNPDINQKGVDEAVATAAPFRVEEGDLSRFKIGFLKTWQLQKKVHRRLAIPYMLFWLCEVAILPWSVNSLSKSFAADFSDERLGQLQKYDHLVARVWGLLFTSPWCGVVTWIFALYPWFSVYYHWRFFHLTKQLVFAKTQIEVAFRTFLRDFDLYFSGYAIHATPSTLLIYLAIILVNTLGHVADKTRLLLAL